MNGKTVPASAAFVSTSSRDLDSLATEDVIRAFKTHGVVMLRGYGADDDKFAELTQRFGGSFVGPVHADALQNRKAVSADGTTSTVNLGTQFVGHHVELGATPTRPDILWFLCVRPAARGGETFVCDAVELWNTLPADLRALFDGREITYWYKDRGPNFWPILTGRSAGRAETIAILDRLPGVKWTTRGSDHLDISYTTPAVVPARYSGRDAFLNSLIGHSLDTVTFADGTPVTRAVQLRLLAAAQRITTKIPWSAGDIVMVDNNRCLHGRMPFEDAGRTIHVRMSDAAF